MINQYRGGGGIVQKGGLGQSADLRGASQGGGGVFAGGLTPQCTLCVLETLSKLT